MAKAQSIAPFPVDIDRPRFGDYLSGFSDGEACFQLLFSAHNTPVASFTIGLRQDDYGVLQLIQSFWECGRLYKGHRTLNGKKIYSCAYVTTRINDLTSVIVPHFQAFPLFAKKRKDLEIWREGVLLIAGRDRKGFHRRWNQSDIERFTLLHDALKSLRGYDAPSVQPPPPLPQEYVPLF